MPSAWYNIMPHLQAWRAGDMFGDEGGSFFGSAASVLIIGMAAFFLRKAPGFASRVAVVFVTAFFINLNFLNVLDHIARAADSETASIRHKIGEARKLSARIDKLQGERRGIGEFRRTSQADVDAAKSAVMATETTRDMECKSGVGLRCEGKNSAVLTARAGLLQLTQQASVTARADELDARLSQAQTDLAALGPLPKHEEATSARLVRFLSFFAPVPETLADGIQDIRPILAAAGYELMATVGPFICMTVLATQTVPPLVAPVLPEPPQYDPDPPVAPKPDKPFQTVYRPARKGSKRKARKALPPPKKVIPIAAQLAPPTPGIREWFDVRIVQRDGEEITARDIYLNYLDFCKSSGVEPVSQALFGRRIQSELGVTRETRPGNRIFYVGVTWRRGSLRVVPNDGDIALKA